MQSNNDKSSAGFGTCHYQIRLDTEPAHASPSKGRALLRVVVGHWCHRIGEEAHHENVDFAELLFPFEWSVTIILTVRKGSRHPLD